MTDGPIELRLTSAGQLFNTLDPVPFREGDLADDAERYILDQTEDLPRRGRVAIRVHMPPGPDATRVPEAITTHFGRRAAASSRALREHFRGGRLALILGLSILASCLGLAVALALEGGGGIARVAQESLVILGWVALWRPCEIFLYDWIPLARRRRIFRRLAQAEVTIAPTATA